ncbi:hypothetical protein KDM41_12375 [bacterium]|nr:hypothetical protein [bacterium]
MAKTSRNPSARFAPRLGGLAVGCVLLAGALPAAAIDGRLDVRQTHQEGRSGTLAYQTDNLREVYSLGERASLTSRLYFSLDALVRRESLESTSLFATTTSDRTSLLPNATLTYRTDHHRLGLTGRATRTDQVRTGQADQRDEYLDATAWYNGTWATWQLDASVQETASWRYAVGSDRENREHNLGATAIWDMSPRDQFSYRFARSRQDAESQGVHTTFTTNNAQYRGDHGFADGRGRFSVHALANHFRQQDRRDDQFSLVYVPPALGSYTLDDTPESLDPLEDDPVAVPDLIDNDRDTPTAVDLGDNASVVREFGGDYRNIALDFGEPREVSELRLYVDRRVDFPGLMQWLVYASDDPDGRDWSAGPPRSAYTVSYFENETGRQGWLVRFTSPVSHRRFKLVNVKIGPVAPDLFVTEFEPWATSVGTTPDRTSSVLNARVNAQAEYDLTRRLTARLSTNINNRYYDEDERDLRGLAWVAGLTQRWDTWTLMGQYESHTLRGETRQDTKSNSQLVSLTRTGDRNLIPRFSWNRTVDESFINQHETNNFTGDVTWRIAPLLVFFQKVSYGLRDDPTLTATASSWVLVSELRGTPRPSVRFELRRSDRWVSEEAAADYRTFNDTELNVSWSLLPLLQLSSQAVYQQREEDDWFYRNTLTWTPLTGGSMLFRFFVNHQEDTRTDYRQRGGGASVTWRPRPRLDLFASVDKSIVDQLGERNDPLSYTLRGAWSF